MVEQYKITNRLSVVVTPGVGDMGLNTRGAVSAAWLSLLLLGSPALNGCESSPATRELSRVRLGEDITAIQQHYGGTRFNISNLTTGGRTVWYKGKDGGQVVFDLNPKGRIVGITVTSRAYPGTPEGLKVGDDKKTMLKVYGENYVVVVGEGGYSYNYRRGNHRLAFVFESYKDPTINAIVLDDRIDLLRRK